jgi:glycosyltransferase involved in cell wall biosynthesis
MTPPGNPLVSVGVPTYNRPDGLRRTLTQICAQSYHNIEILVSDNASPNDDTFNVVGEFQSRDSRIRYFRQTANVGPTENFRLVLRKAAGDFFMWAADDDEWDPRFVEICLGKIGDAGSAMAFHKTHFRASDQWVEERVPALKEANGPCANASAFLDVLDSVLFYGLHRKSTIQSFFTDEMFDFYDCFFVFRQVIENDFVIVPEWLFASGVDAPEYQHKTVDSLKKSRFQYLPFLRACAKTIVSSKKLGFLEKGVLLNRVVQKTLELFCWYEKTLQPRSAEYAEALKRVLNHIEGFVTRRFGI